jgi:hypothetical protein
MGFWRLWPVSNAVAARVNIEVVQQTHDQMQIRIN